MHLILRVVFLLAGCIHGWDGPLRFASYYGDHMVLQKSPARAVLWGYGPEGARVSVYLSGPSNHSTTPVTVTQGIWRTILDPINAGGPYMVKVVSENSTAVLEDVLFGDIWLCGGQSNMYFQISQMFNASDELALVPKYPHVRTFMAALEVSEIEQLDLIQVEVPWSVPTVDIVSNFSAVCWLFGRYLSDVLKYPIGLVESCWGGTTIEAWSSQRALQRCGLQEFSGPRNDSVLWNSMIHPLLSMTIYGAIWYQGEANTIYHQSQYNCSFPAMIDDWRLGFHQGSSGQTALDFPFGFVQLSTNDKHSTTDGFPNIRWHQTADFGFVPNQRMKKTFMAVAMDLPDESSPFGTIHPRDKQDVASRLLLGARAVAYNEKGVTFLGPFPEQILFLQESVIISYDQNISVTQSKDVFEVCCEAPDGSGPQARWVPAPIIDWNSTAVHLWTPWYLVRKAAAVRYAWRDWPCNFKACPIYSADKILPAPPYFYKAQEKEPFFKGAK